MFLQRLSIMYKLWEMYMECSDELAQQMILWFYVLKAKLMKNAKYVDVCSFFAVHSAYLHTHS